MGVPDKEIPLHFWVPDNQILRNVVKFSCQATEMEWNMVAGDTKKEWNMVVGDPNKK